MRVNTKRFGEINIETDKIIDFPEGIFAFEQFHRYILLATKEDTEFYWLQCIDDPGLAFLVVNAAIHLPRYKPQIDNEYLSLLGVNDISKTECWLILTIPSNEPGHMTVNLQGPLLINPEKKAGAQFISVDETHTIRAPFLEYMQTQGQT
ncbi:MAG: flagellar assembly protein FliW [Spirochaetia bacterium]|nr:flagellar assembly protein FliW [Spirochaetia bacterium]